MTLAEFINRQLVFNAKLLQGQNAMLVQVTSLQSAVTDLTAAFTAQQAFDAALATQISTLTTQLAAAQAAAQTAAIPDQPTLDAIQAAASQVESLVAANNARIAAQAPQAPPSGS